MRSDLLSDIKLIQKNDFKFIQQNLVQNIFLIADNKVVNLYPDIIQTLKNENSDLKVLEIDTSHEVKTLDNFELLCESLLNQGLTRNGHIIVLGGGAMSDLAGFAASSFMRGVSWSVIPTTILSMVDASIGGKTGIDTNKGKNLIGSFHAPENIFIYSEFIHTLSKKEQDSGKGEILKYALLSKEIFESIRAKKDLGLIMNQCAQFKMEVVKTDPFEKGMRKILNLGHTFGHAYEKITSLPHGVCVIWGIRFMDEFFWENKFKDSIDLIIKNLEVEEINYFDSLQINKNSLLEYAQNDKKRSSKESIDLIMLKEIGAPYIEPYSLKKLESLLY